MEILCHCVNEYHFHAWHVVQISKSHVNVWRICKLRGLYKYENLMQMCKESSFSCTVLFTNMQIPWKEPEFSYSACGTNMEIPYQSLKKQHFNTRQIAQICKSIPKYSKVAFSCSTGWTNRNTSCQCAKNQHFHTQFNTSCTNI